jgi:hypothetical protein
MEIFERFEQEITTPLIHTTNSKSFLSFLIIPILKVEMTRQFPHFPASFLILVVLTSSIEFLPLTLIKDSSGIGRVHLNSYK